MNDDPYIGDRKISAWKHEDFGGEYTKRNPLSAENTALRVPLFEKILAALEPNFPSSILEVGAGTGNNICAIEQIYQRTQTPFYAYATEPNEGARDVLRTNVSEVVSSPAQKIDYPDGIADFVFTSGVLIHIPPADHLKAMGEIFRCSKLWIASIEYFNPALEMVEYRDCDDMMWRRDWGSLWLDNFKVKCLDVGFCWKRTTGLDDLTFWVFEKL